MQRGGQGGGPRPGWLPLEPTREGEETRKYVQELEEYLVTVDQLICLSSRDRTMGARCIGAEAAPGWRPWRREIRAAGAKYCD